MYNLSFKVTKVVLKGEPMVKISLSKETFKQIRKSPKYDTQLYSGDIPTSYLEGRPYFLVVDVRDINSFTLKTHPKGDKYPRYCKINSGTYFTPEDWGKWIEFMRESAIRFVECNRAAKKLKNIWKGEDIITI